MNLQWRPLSSALGAEVLDLDLRQDLSPELMSQIRDLWHRTLVLLFRDQQLDSEDQLRFARHFGELQSVRTRSSYKDEYVMYVANVSVEGKEPVLPRGEMHFHFDQCYYECPARATLLYAMEVPPAGGNTLFSNTQRAYEALPGAVKDHIRGLLALNVYDYDFNPTVRRGEVRPDAPQFAHPVVIVHPETGSESLFVSRLMTDHIVGLERDESDRLLEQLWATQERPEFIYEHVWRPGDLLLWDNLCAMHARTDFDPSQRRVLRRVAIRGVRPQAAAAAELSAG